MLNTTDVDTISKDFSRPT